MYGTFYLVNRIRAYNKFIDKFNIKGKVERLLLDAVASKVNRANCKKKKISSEEENKHLFLPSKTYRIGC